MAKYLLDTDTFSLLVDGSAAIRARLARVAPSDVEVSPAATPVSQIGSCWLNSRP